MKPTEILSNEHRVIEQVLACLGRLIDESNAAGKLDAALAGEVLDFVRNFADRCHHAKEEDLLFPAMEARGLSPDAGPTAVMRHEHDEGRGHVRAMAEARESAAAGDAAALRRFAVHGRAFIELLRAHIEKEDQILYTMANRVLTDADQRQLLTSFGQVETTKMTPGTHEKYLEVATRLAHRFGVTAVVRSGACNCCGH